MLLLSRFFFAVTSLCCTLCALFVLNDMYPTISPIDVPFLLWAQVVAEAGGIFGFMAILFWVAGKLIGEADYDR